MTGNEAIAPVRHSGKQKVTLVVLAVLALATVFLLPRLVSGPLFVSVEPPGAVPSPASPTSVSPSTAAEKTAYRQESQSVLAQIVARRDRLQQSGVESWGAVPFKQVLDRVSEGDEDYHYGEYRASLDAYRQALELLVQLEDQSAGLLEQSLAEGERAIEDLNVNTATSAIGLAGTIAAADPRVRNLQQRLAALPEVVSNMEAGDLSRARGDVSAARESYRLAAQADPAHQRAARALEEMRSAQTDGQFRQHMSRGYAAMEQGDYDGARAAFADAGGVYPGHPAIAQALAQLDNKRSMEQVGARMRRVEQMEQDEQWQQAKELYEGLLAEDPSLSEARVRLIPVTVRAALDDELQAFIDEPLKVSSQAGYQRAQAVLADARGIASPGPRLAAQVERLDALLQAAVSLVDVEFRSDNQTEVVLFRVAELGRFERHSMRLRPGKYIAAGTRKGFRDVRVEFIISGMDPPAPVVVRCDEPI